jgi:type IX secretion system PorP/SprF family membrane protein
VKHRAIITLLLLTGATFLYSQQDPLVSQYMFGIPSYNPGASGSTGMVCATAINRQQWVGLPGAPVTTTFNVNAPLRLFRSSSGIGVTVRSDKAGFDSDIGLSLSYSYFFDIGQGRLGVGLSAGMLNKTLDPTWVIPSGDIYVPAAGDPLIPENKESFVAFDAALGVFYVTGKYYAGFSVTHINQPTFKFSKGNPYLTRHYYATAGYNFVMPNPAFEFKPSLLAFSDGRVIQLTVSSVVTYNKKVWGGVSYRAGDALIGMAGVELYNGIRLGYAYDFSMTDIRKNTSGSHEFLINYCFEISMGRSPMKYKSVRFL